MANIKVRYLVTKKGRDGSRHFWQPGRKLRLAGWAPKRLSDNAAQAIAEAEALNAQVDAWRLTGCPALDGMGPAAGARAGTLDALIADYKSSSFFTDLKPRSQKLYGIVLQGLSTWGGDMLARNISAEAVDNLYATLRAAAPAKANLYASVLRLVFNYGLRYGRVAHNPAAKARIKGLPYSGIIWPAAAVEAFVAKADALGMYGLGTALLLNYWIGHNTIDVIGLPRPVYRNGDIRLERSKTGRRAVLPVDMIAALRVRLDGELRRQESAGVTPLTLIVRHETWQPYTEATFARDFKAVRAAVAAETPAFYADGDTGETVETQALMFRYLRHTAVTVLAARGCTALQIAAITTHSPSTVNQILEHYFDRTRAVAAAAFEKRLAKEGDG